MYSSLDALKQALGVTDNSRDGALLIELNVATELINNLTGRDFTASGAVATTRTFTVPSAVGYDLPIDAIGDTTGLVVSAGGPVSYAALLATSYVTLPDNAPTLGRPVTALRNVSYPWTLYPYVQVTARWGWPATPASVDKAALLLASRLYRRKDSPEGVIGSAEWGAIRVSNIDPDVRALLSSYMLPGFA